MHRADTLIKYKERKNEKEKIRDDLRKCGYPEWALREGEQKRKKRKNSVNEQTDKPKPNGFVVLPYTKGLSERLKISFHKRKISLYQKAGQSIH